MDGSSPETCAECGFDASLWRLRDAGTLFGALGTWWRSATAGVPDDTLNRRPAPEVWSALEYGVHSARVSALIRAGIDAILAEDGCDLGPPPAAPAGSGPPMAFTSGATVRELDQVGKALAELAGRRAAPWTNMGRLGGATVQAEAALFHAVHDVSHHMLDVSRGLAAVGAATQTSGHVVQVNVSRGGVPKNPLEHGTAVGLTGLAGDGQADRKHHGRPFQAVCLWSTEVIDELTAAGHPIGPGCAGENFTLQGIPWCGLRAGSLLHIGSAVIELSFPAVPCAKQTRWFSDGDFDHISYDRNPGWARWYGWVRQPGFVRPGDPAQLGAPPTPS